MSTPWTSYDLDCLYSGALCHCPTVRPHRDQPCTSPMPLMPACHPEASLRVYYKDAVLLFLCTACFDTVLEVQVQESPVPVPPI